MRRNQNSKAPSGMKVYALVLLLLLPATILILLLFRNFSSNAPREDRQVEVTSLFELRIIEWLLVDPWLIFIF